MSLWITTQVAINQKRLQKCQYLWSACLKKEATESDVSRLMDID